jgi:hypothetical protein
MKIYRRLCWCCCALALCAAEFAVGVGAQEIVGSAPIELRRHMPVAEVMIDGLGPFHFAIDTGSGGEAAVSGELIEKLVLPVIRQEEVGDPSGTNQQKVDVVRIESLKFAGVQFKDVRATRLVEMGPGPGRNVDGILGFLLFRDYLLSIDFPGQRVSLLKGSLPAADGEQILSFRMPNNVPVIEMTIGGKTMDAHVDTGGMGLSLPDKIAGGLAFASEPVVIGHGRTISHEFDLKGAQLISEIRLGGYTFPKPFVEINPLFPVVNFGAIPLRNFVVTFDQKNKLVRFMPNEKTIQLNAPRMMGGPPRAEMPAQSGGDAPR